MVSSAWWQSRRPQSIGSAIALFANVLTCRCIGIPLYEPRPFAACNAKGRFATYKLLDSISGMQRNCPPQLVAAFFVICSRDLNAIANNATTLRSGPLCKLTCPTQSDRQYVYMVQGAAPLRLWGKPQRQSHMMLTLQAHKLESVTTVLQLLLRIWCCQGLDFIGGSFNDCLLVDKFALVPVISNA